MIAKIFAQAARSHGRQVLTQLLIATVISTVALATAFIPIPWLSSMMKGVVFGVLVATPFAVIVLVAESYWRTMYRDEGYFTHSLPVRARDLFWGKALYILAAEVAAFVFSAALGAATLFIFLVREQGWESARIAVEALLAQVNGGGLALAALVTLLWLFVNATAIPAMMSLGAQARWNSRGFLFPLVFLVGYYIVNQVVLAAATLFIPVSLDWGQGRVVFESMLPQVVANMRDGTPATIVGLGGIVFVPLLALAASWWAVRVIERRTSLR
ncbi:MAG: hypothetical protein Q3999_03320 [Buchananella hordeovulneris]|nr:hypothetical protein [Buchananella hordeovulneris]